MRDPPITVSEAVEVLIAEYSPLLKVATCCMRMDCPFRKKGG